jgi:hypothetical protein
VCFGSCAEVGAAAAMLLYLFGNDIACRGRLRSKRRWSSRCLAVRTSRQRVDRKQSVPFAVNPNGHVNETTLKNDYKFFRERGLIDGKVTVDQVIDSSFANQAVETLGPYKPAN